MQTRGTPATRYLPSGTQNCTNHPSRCECQLFHKQSRRRCWCPLWSTMRLSGGISRSYNPKSTPPSSESSMLVLLWSESLVLHREIGTPHFTYYNPFVHVPQCLQEFDGMKECPFCIDPLWRWPVRDVIIALPLHLAGTVWAITLLVVLRGPGIHHGLTTGTDGCLTLGEDKKHQRNAV
jgi:hypothetical protein